MPEGWQGPPNINKVKQDETVSSFKFSLSEDPLLL